MIKYSCRENKGGFNIGVEILKLVCQFIQLFYHNPPLVVAVEHTATRVLGLGFDFQAGRNRTQCRRRCDVPSELCCPGAKSRRWISPLVTRFGVISRL